MINELLDIGFDSRGLSRTKPALRPAAMQIISNLSDEDMLRSMNIPHTPSLLAGSFHGWRPGPAAQRGPSVLRAT
jgi:hypothetical protein